MPPLQPEPTTIGAIVSATGVIISALTGGLAGAIIAHFTARIRDKQARKRAFRNYVRSVGYEIQDTEAKQGELIAKHGANRQELRRQCVNITEDIKPGNRKEFAACWMHYCTMTEREIEPSTGGDWEKDGLMMFKPEFEKGKADQIQLLENLISCAN